MPDHPAPPHFKGFDTQGMFHNHERKLPHWRQPGATYFVTFRLADSIPQNVLALIRRMRREIHRLGPQAAASELRDRYEREVTQRLEAALDQGYGSCILAEPDNASIVRECLDFGLGVRHFTGCGVIMPNHCHIVIRPSEGTSLEDHLKSAKGISARRINQRLGTSGSLWEIESYDRIIRDEEHLRRVIQYIGRNPTKCGLPRKNETCWVHSEWCQAGFGFEEVALRLLVPPD